jgi:membrane associated rhomboid family serine protease
MATLADDLLLEVLKACAEAAPVGLYPAAFAAYSGLDRGVLDEALDYLRLRGLVRFTDWERDKGQGYTLTSQGTDALQNPRLLKHAQLAKAEPALARVSDRSDHPWARGEAVRDTLLNPVRPVVCMTLLGLNILVFVIGLVLAMKQGIDAGDYLKGSGNRGVAAIQDELGSLSLFDIVVKDEWWRLLSYAFVHAGLLHIGMNMYFLFSLGPLLETLWGSVRFLWLYLVAALWGGCAVMITQRAAVGASGALCGLLTSMGVWVYLNRRHLPPNLVSNWMRTVFTNVILIAVISTLPSVSWEGHLGGALGGAIVSLPLNYQRFGRGGQKLLGLIGALAVPVVAVGYVVQDLSSVQGQYQTLREKYRVQHNLYPSFEAAEINARKAYRTAKELDLKGWKSDVTPARIADAKAAFAGAQETLDEALRAFDNAGPFQDKGVAFYVVKGRAYLEEWTKYFALYDKIIAHIPPWHAEDTQALQLQVANIARAQRPFINSELLTSALDEIKVED